MRAIYVFRLLPRELLGDALGRLRKVRRFRGRVAGMTEKSGVMRERISRRRGLALASISSIAVK